MCMFSFGLSHATQAPGELELVSVSDTIIQIDWEDVTDVLWYYIYYWESSGIDTEYDIEWVDLIEESNYELTGLDPQTQYFLAITAVDETGSESSKSPELQAVTLATGSESQELNLRVVSVWVVDESSIEIEFSLNMETGVNAAREFIIENANTGTEIGVDISDVIPWESKKILAILDGNLQSNSEYRITVLDIRDENGNTIESGIDAFVNFTTPEVFNTELQSAGPEQVVEDDPVVEDIPVDDSRVDETSAEESTATPSWNNAGTTISDDDLSDNTLNAAAENEKLPQTGPEHWILLLVTVMLGTGLFYKFRK